MDETYKGNREKYILDEVLAGPGTQPKGPRAWGLKVHHVHLKKRA